MTDNEVYREWVPEPPADCTVLLDTHDSRSLLMSDFDLGDQNKGPFPAFSYNELRLAAPSYG